MNPARLFKTLVFTIQNAPSLQMSGWLAGRPAGLLASWLAELAGLGLPSSPNVPHMISAELAKVKRRTQGDVLILRGHFKNSWKLWELGEALEEVWEALGDVRARF